MVRLRDFFGVQGDQMGVLLAALLYPAHQAPAEAQSHKAAANSEQGGGNAERTLWHQTAITICTTLTAGGFVNECREKDT